jgi:hypothetical protein
MRTTNGRVSRTAGNKGKKKKRTNGDIIIKGGKRVSQKTDVELLPEENCPITVYIEQTDRVRL